MLTWGKSKSKNTPLCGVGTGGQHVSKEAKKRVGDCTTDDVTSALRKMLKGNLPVTE
jgi:hypothetical protein